MCSTSLHAGTVRLGTTPPMSLLPQLATVNSSSAPISFPALAGGLLGQKESDPPPPTTVTKKGMLESSGSTERLFIVEGIRPVPKKLAEKARAWQYINLVELLPSKPYCVEDKWSLLQQAQADGQVVLVQSMEQLKRSKRDIADILSWVEAFTTLIAIVGSTDASAVPHMVAYLLRVIRAARVKGSQWIEFDKEYRMKAAAQGNRNWSVHDADLWDHYITTAATLHSQEGSMGAVHAVSSSRQNAGEGPRSFTRGGQKPIKRGRGEGVPPQTAPWKKNICYSFNFDGACSREAQGNSCHFRHSCYSCGQGDHAALECPQRGTKVPKKD